MTTYRALLVANSTFPHDADNLPELEGPRNDAALLRDALCDRSYGLFASDNVRLVQERAMGDVLREVEDFLRSASRQDTLLLYYSGHGVLDQSNEFFLCAHNSRTDRLRSTAIKASDISQMIDESAAATTLIFLDCCHSGRFKSGDVPSRLAGEGRFVVTSSRGGELARDAHAQNHASLFTHHLVEGMMGQAPDHDRDGLVSLTDLYDYVHDALRDAGRQVPQKRFEGSGDVPIAMRPGSVAVAEDPELLDPAAAQPVLDVSTTEIDLGQVDADEELPPERILVINRGGGTLQWKAESSADWVRAVTDETGIELHLDPGPGSHRANVYVTDERTGSLKTVRVRVRVGDGPSTGEVAAVTAAVAAAAPVVVEPEPPALVEPEPPALVEHEPPAVVEPEPPDVDDRPATRPGWRARATAVAPILAAAAALGAVYVTVSSGARFADEIASEVGTELVLRSDWGVGMLETFVVAAAVIAAALVVLLSARRRTAALGVLAASGLAMALLRIAESSQWGEEYWRKRYPSFEQSALAALAAVVLAGVAIGLRGRAVHRPRPFTRAGTATVVLAVVWSVALAQDLYSYSEGLFGDHTTERGDGRTAQIVLLVILVALVAAAVSCLASSLGRGVLLGVASVALGTAVAEICFALFDPLDGGFGYARLPILLVPALAFVGWVVLVTARRHPLSRSV